MNSQIDQSVDLIWMNECVEARQRDYDNDHAYYYYYHYYLCK